MRALLARPAPAFVAPDEIFTEYAYFSAYSTSWVEHARAVRRDDPRAARARRGRPRRRARLERRLPPPALRRHRDPDPRDRSGRQRRRRRRRSAAFRRSSRSSAARRRGELVGEGKRAALVVGNNVLAQVPDLNDFVGGVKILLRDDGTATFEFPHLLRLLDGLQYDTIYHEHFSYFSFATIVEILRRARARGVRRRGAVDARRLAARLRAARGRAARRRATPSPSCSHARRRADSARPSATRASPRTSRSRSGRSSSCLIGLRRDGKQVVGYGAPGKGNTLLNYCGIRTDLLDYTVDRNPYKHGLFTPGTHIPIHPPERIAETTPGLRRRPAVEPRSTRSRASSRTSPSGAAG